MIIEEDFLCTMPINDMMAGVSQTGSLETPHNRKEELTDKLAGKNTIMNKTLSIKQEKSFNYTKQSNQNSLQNQTKEKMIEHKSSQTVRINYQLVNSEQWLGNNAQTSLSNNSSPSQVFKAVASADSSKNEIETRTFQIRMKQDELEAEYEASKEGNVIDFIKKLVYNDMNGDLTQFSSQ